MDEILIEKYLLFLKQVKKLSDNSIIYYHSYFKRFDPDITQDSVNKFIQKYNNSVAKGMILNYIEFLEYEGSDNINIKLPKIRARKKTRIVHDITTDELQKLREHLFNKNIEYGLIFELIYQGALRRSEIQTININSFNWTKWFENSDDFIELRIIGKNDKERIVLINSITATFMMQELMERHEIHEDNIAEFLSTNSSLVFPEVSGSKVYGRISKRTRKILSIPIRPHELRHQKATELSDNGVELNDIKNYLGHSSITTTERYVRRSEKESIKNIKKIMG